ncbi:MAG: hypothetical protein IKX76_05075, partial [Eubacterium sp.]|nr:hypothetical protein [Eubacterium sp.]
GSDGAFGNIRQNHLEQMVKEKRDKSQILPGILEYARNQGENDNQTAFLISPPGRKTEPSRKEDRVVTGVEGKDFIPLEEIIPVRQIIPGQEIAAGQKAFGRSAEELKPLTDKEQTRFREVREESLKDRFLKIFGKGREED